MKIYLPLISPTMFYLIITDISHGMMVMGIINILTAGGPENSTLSIMQYIYQQLSGMGNYTNANAASIILFIIVFTISYFAFKWEKRGVHYQ